MATRLPVLGNQQVARLGAFGLFETISGGKITAEMQKYFAAGEQFPDTIQGTSDIADITISRAYDPVQDADVVAYCLQALGKIPGTPTVPVQRIFLDPSGKLPIASFTYENCKVTGLTFPDGKAGDNGTLFLEITLTTGKISP